MSNPMPLAWQAPCPTEDDMLREELAADRADFEAEQRAEWEWEMAQNGPRNDDIAADIAAERDAERALIPGYGT